LIAFLLLGLASAQQKQITVAAASDMSFALKEIAAQYEKQTGVQVRISFGASGNLYQQIRNGSPLDVYLSADEQFPAKLAEEGIGDKSSLKHYATGSLVIWVPSHSPLDDAKLGDKVLLDPRVKHIAIANPATAPYGRAAEAALRSLQYWDKLRSKIVFGENISQTAQFVQSGNADIGIISLSHALSEALKGGRFVRIDQAFHPPIKQSLIVIARKGGDATEAKKFADYLSSADAQEVLKCYGFELPEQSKPVVEKANKKK
jgi:molybdate transport system substrate-binding protein